MADDTDPLVQAMIDAGLYPQQVQQLQRQYGLGQQLMETPSAQGRQVGQAYVAASPLEHLANAISRFTGVGMMKNAQQGEQDQLAKLGAGRQRYMQESQIAAGVPQPGTPDMLARPADPRRQQQLEAMAMASGDAPMQQAAQFLRASSQFAQQHGPQAALGGLTPETARAQAELKRAEAAEAGVAKYAVNSVTGKTYDVRTGKEVGGGGGPGAEQYDKRLGPMQQKFAQDFDPNISRGGVNKGNQERLNAANRLLALAVDPLTGGPANLTPQQMSEVSTSLATLIGGGGSSEGSRHELTPYTKGRKLAEVMQWLTDKPQGADQQAFVKQMIDTARREQGVAQGAIRTSQDQRLANHLAYYNLFPDAAKSQMEAYGIDPSEVDLHTGRRTAKPPPPPPRSAGGGPRRTVGGETREWDGQKWVPVSQ